jgi:hypothetical protein
LTLYRSIDHMLERIMIATPSDRLGATRKLALGLGIFFPCIETCRRAGQFLQPRMWPSIFDDYLAGLLLLAAVWQTRRSGQRGYVWLAGAFGYCVGMMWGSFFGQLLEPAGHDPSGMPTSVVVAFKGVLFALCSVGFVTALRAAPTATHEDADSRVVP